MNPRELLEKARNNPRDVRSSDFVLLTEAFDSRLDRGHGSHRIYQHAKIPVHLSIQPESSGKANSHQINPILGDTAAYGIKLEDEA